MQHGGSEKPTTKIFVCMEQLLLFSLSLYVLWNPAVVISGVGNVH